MSDENMMPPDVLALLEREKRRAAPPSDMEDRVFSRLGASILGALPAPGSPNVSSPSAPAADGPGDVAGTSAATAAGTAGAAGTGASVAAGGVATGAATAASAPLVAMSAAKLVAVIVTSAVAGAGAGVGALQTFGTAPEEAHVATVRGDSLPETPVVVPAAAPDAGTEPEDAAIPEPRAEPERPRPRPEPAKTAAAPEPVDAGPASETLEAGSEPAVARDRLLAAERGLLDQARTALARNRPADALAALARHANEHPQGQLAEEREALTILALVAAGRAEEARVKAQRFHEQYPRSVLWRSVKAALAKSP